LFLRVVLLGSAGAIAGAWLAPQLGFPAGEVIMPGTLGALAALGLAALLFGPRR
jgi:hypothetical protein